LKFFQPAPLLKFGVRQQRARQMDEVTLREYILRACPGTTVVDAGGDSYYFTDPEQKHPFATLVTSDAHDQASDLGRPGVFRLNIGVSKGTFQSLFAAATEADHDFTALDRLMPHPVYGKMYWLCVLNPGPAISEAVRGLLAEAYTSDMRRRKPAEPCAEADGGA
jgi:Family of unknown function (DUF6194)